VLHPELEADRELLLAVLTRYRLPLDVSMALSAAADELVDPPALPVLRYVDPTETADPLQAVRDVRARLTAAAVSVRGGVGEALRAARAARELLPAERDLAGALPLQERP
jgi:hypothetical protein